MLPVLDSRMACIDEGHGDPIVFLHGNPTSSYLWRNVIPHLRGSGRCVAPDLVGMGDSDKLPGTGHERYGFLVHRRYLEALLSQLGVERNVTLVLHDWGGPLGFDWAMRHPRALRGIVFMETFVVAQDDANTPRQVQQFFLDYRTDAGARSVLDDNQFVERVLLGQLPHLAEEDRQAYRRPFLQPGEGRMPTLAWPRQVPINGQPADVAAQAHAHLAWMAHTPTPKLFIRGEPGGLIRMGRERVCRAWPNTTEVVVPGGHYLPEHSPDAIGKAIANWLRHDAQAAVAGGGA